MRRVPKLVLLALTQLAAALSFAHPAHAATVDCSAGYDRISQHVYWETYEQGVGYAQCAYGPVDRIDVQLTYVYCPTSTSCNTTGSNFSGTDHDGYLANAAGSIYNLRGWYKVIIRSSFTLYPGQSFTWHRGNEMAWNKGSCGQSSTNYWSCAFESDTFQRGM